MNGQRFDHLVQIRSARLLRLSENFDLLLEGTNLFVLLLTMSAIVGFVNVNYFDRNNISGAHNATAIEPDFSAQHDDNIRKILPLVHSAKGTFTNQLVESISWNCSTAPPTFLNDTRLLRLR